MPSVQSLLNKLQADVHKSVSSTLDVKRTQSKELREAIKSAFDAFDVSALTVAKVPKSKDAPKRAQNCYMIYFNEVRPSIKVANPTLSVGEIAKLIGASWKALGDADKAKYRAKEAEAKSHETVPVVSTPVTPLPTPVVSQEESSPKKGGKKVKTTPQQVEAVLAPVQSAVDAPVQAAVEAQVESKVKKAKKVTPKTEA